MANKKKDDDKKPKKKNKTTVVFILFLAVSALFIYYISQQEVEVKNNFCDELGTELVKNDLDCLCSERSDIPEQYQNLSIVGLCECKCYVNNTWINTLIAVPNNETNTTINNSIITPIV